MEINRPLARVIWGLQWKFDVFDISPYSNRNSSGCCHDNGDINFSQLT